MRAPSRASFRYPTIKISGAKIKIKNNHQLTSNMAYNQTERIKKPKDSALSTEEILFMDLVYNFLELFKEEAPAMRK